MLSTRPLEQPDTPTCPQVPPFPPGGASIANPRQEPREIATRTIGWLRRAPNLRSLPMPVDNISAMLQSAEFPPVKASGDVSVHRAPATDQVRGKRAPSNYASLGNLPALREYHSVNLKQHSKRIAAAEDIQPFFAAV